MEFDGNFTGAFQHHGDQGSRPLRSQKPADIFEANAPRLDGSRFARLARVVLVRVTRRDRVNQIRHSVHAGFLEIVDFFLESRVVVPWIGRTGQGKTVGNQALDQQLENTVGRLFEGAVHTAVIAEAGFFEPLGTFTQPVPGIFFVLTRVLLEHDAEKELHGLEAGLIHMFRRRQHGADFHVKRQQAWVAVAQGGVDESNFVAHLASGRWFKSFKPVLNSALIPRSYSPDILESVIPDCSIGNPRETGTGPRLKSSG